MSGEVKLSIRRMSQEARSRITTAVGISMKNGFPNKGFVKDIALEDCRIGNNGQLNRHAKVVAKIFFHAWHSVSFGSERAKILRKRREQELFESRQRELQAVRMPLLKSTLASWKQFTQLSKDGCLPADQNVEESTDEGDFLWKSLQVKITGGEHNKRHTAYQRLKRKIQLAQAMERLSRRAPPALPSGLAVRWTPTSPPGGDGRRPSAAAGPSRPASGRPASCSPRSPRRRRPGGGGGGGVPAPSPSAPALTFGPGPPPPPPSLLGRQASAPPNPNGGAARGGGGLGGGRARARAPAAAAAAWEMTSFDRTVEKMKAIYRSGPVPGTPLRPARATTDRVGPRPGRRVRTQVDQLADRHLMQDQYSSSSLFPPFGFEGQRMHMPPRLKNTSSSKTTVVLPKRRVRTKNKMVDGPSPEELEAELTASNFFETESSGQHEGVQTYYRTRSPESHKGSRQAHRTELLSHRHSRSVRSYRALHQLAGGGGGSPGEEGGAPTPLLLPGPSSPRLLGGPGGPPSARFAHLAASSSSPGGAFAPAARHTWDASRDGRPEKSTGSWGGTYRPTAVEGGGAGCFYDKDFFAPPGGRPATAPWKY